MGKTRSKYACGVKTDINASWHNLIASTILRIVAVSFALLAIGIKFLEHCNMIDKTAWWGVTLFLALIGALLYLVSAILALIGILQDPKI